MQANNRSIVRTCKIKTFHRANCNAHNYYSQIEFPWLGCPERKRTLSWTAPLFFPFCHCFVSAGNWFYSQQPKAPASPIEEVAPFRGPTRPQPTTIGLTRMLSRLACRGQQTGCSDRGITWAPLGSQVAQPQPRLHTSPPHLLTVWA